MEYLKERLRYRDLTGHREVTPDEWEQILREFDLFHDKYDPVGQSVFAQVYFERLMGEIQRRQYRAVPDRTAEQWAAVMVEHLNGVRPEAEVNDFRDAIAYAMKIYAGEETPPR